jgi:Zn-finger nucleic acid-binding protein
MNCPRGHGELTVEHHAGIEVDHCRECNGRWLDHNELDQLEATSAPDADHRKGMVTYARRESDLDCPVCGKRMVAFNYRANPLELDTCEDEHGFWLDAGEEGRVRDLIEDRVRGLSRAATAEQAWGEFLRGVGDKSAWDNVKNFFKGGGRRR